MKEPITRYDKSLEDSCFRWFNDMGLHETLWILDIVYYMWRKDNGFTWSYKDFVSERKNDD